MKTYYYYIACGLSILGVGTGMLATTNPEILDGLRSAIIGTAVTTPTVTLGVGTGAVAYGGTRTVTWSSTNVLNCTLTTGSSNDYAPLRTPLSGTKVVGPLSLSRTISISCLGKNGKTVTVIKTITVVPFTTSTGTTSTGTVASGSTVNFALPPSIPAYTGTTSTSTPTATGTTSTGTVASGSTVNFALPPSIPAYTGTTSISTPTATGTTSTVTSTGTVASGSTVNFALPPSIQGGGSSKNTMMSEM